MEIDSNEFQFSGGLFIAGGGLEPILTQCRSFAGYSARDAAHYQTKMAAAMRMVLVDMPYPDAARFAVPVGRIGQPIFGMYTDMTPLLARGRNVKILTDARSIGHYDCRRPTLVPSRE